MVFREGPARIGEGDAQAGFGDGAIGLPCSLSRIDAGEQPRTDEDFGIRLGTLQLHGERGALSVGAEQLSRLNSNPFHAYIVARIGEGIAADSAR